MKLKSLSYGLDSFRTIEDEKFILNKYKDYIDSVYLGPPTRQLNIYFTDRPDEYIRTYRQTYYDEILNYVQELGIKINFTLNSNLYKKNFKSAIINKFLDNASTIIEPFNPNEICIVDDYAEYFKQRFPNIKLCRSFHEGYPTQEVINKNIFNTFILRTNYLNIHKTFIPNVENRLVLNVACPNMCPGCYGEHTQHEDHFAMFEKELAQVDNHTEIWIAQHAWFGRDIELLEESFPNFNISYKIATRCRSATLKGVQTIFDNYINKLSFNETYFHNYTSLIENACYLYAPGETIKNFDLELFNQNKIKFWQKINAKIDKY